MRRIGFYCCMLLVLAGCKEGHFISDKGYREKVETDFETKKALFGEAAEELYAVFDTPMSREEREALTFLYAYSTVSDIAYWGGEFLLQNVRLSLRAREEMPWGKRIPEEVFRHFVLPVRGNNEALDSSRQVFYDALKERVSQCATMEEAALEVNHWCHEHVIYKPTNARTASPLSTMRTTYGRCGEESIFTLAALRAVGIPARQIYTPRWAHCDDNHAWIEVWADGEWKYLGACEPEPRLNLAWFTSPVQQAMYVVADVFGKYEGAEELVKTDRDNSIVNVTAHYTPTSRTIVRVVDGMGQPVQGAKVDYRIFNYGEFYPVATLPSDEQGETALTLGKGDIMVWAWGKDSFGYAPFRVDEQDTLTITLRPANEQKDFEAAFVPPVLRQLPSETSDEERAANDRRLMQEDSIRNAYIATFPTPETAAKQAHGWQIDAEAWQRLLAASKGNYAALEQFMESTPAGQREMAMELLSLVPEKDLQDTPAEVWTAHLEGAFPYREHALFKEYILNPRVDNELLTAYRQPLQAYFKEAGINDATAIAAYAGQFKACDSLYTARYTIPPLGVVRAGVADEKSRDVFFVAACRTLGIPARLNPMTDKPEYFAGEAWESIRFTTDKKEVAAKGSLMLTYQNKHVKDPKYFLNFTIGKMEDNAIRTIDLGSNAAVDMGAGASYAQIFSHPVELEAGHYFLFTGNRHSSGAIYTRICPFEVQAGELTTVEMTIPECPEMRQVVGQITLPPSMKGLDKKQYGILAILDAGTEPTNHFLRDMGASKAEFEALGSPLCFFFKDAANRSKFHPEDFRPFPENLTFEVDDDQLLAKRFSEELHLANAGNLPLVLVVNGNGEVIFVSQGYSIGLGARLLKQAQ